MTAAQNILYESLGLKGDSLTNQIEYIRSVREGIPGDVVKRTIKIFDNRDLIVRVLGTTSSNLSRYYRIKKMKPFETEELLDIIRLYAQALFVFDDLAKAKEWITTPVAALSGEIPEALFDTFEGRHWVSQVLRKIEYGEFS